MTMRYEKLLRKIYAIEDFVFEKYYGFNFSGNIAADDLVTSYATKKNAFEYRPVFIGTLRKLFSEVEKLDCKYQNFIDIGSGKGKACFYALKKQLFKQVIGIEFSKELIDIAIKNQNIIDASNVNFLNMDASNYTLPDEKSLIFLFNPFDQIVLERFLKNNMDHFAVQNSVVAYANDVHRNVLAKMGFETIFRNQTRKISIHRMVT
jgi:SAM-dependent methyltransferase